ncbi:hypothetical protein cyc_05173 [Cyclospora cayetanensis]|uniref:Uncharacterized protein n=1 Tax=Cyclospora cayetanensis TaxID=88456 RepID=A0A1D3CS50_9EIME|nr:hypothetical protein cyc_05173 [Cyclospora cayetanensis]
MPLASVSDPEFEDVPDDDDLPENDENYDYLQATRRLDADELQAEEEGERLIDDQGDDGFVFGMKSVTAREMTSARLQLSWQPDWMQMQMMQISFMTKILDLTSEGRQEREGLQSDISEHAIVFDSLAIAKIFGDACLVRKKNPF